MIFLLTRHGETDWNTQERIQGSTDTDLNENGIRQAQLLADRLISYTPTPTRVYSSKLKRALQTAQIAAKRLSAKGHPSSDRPFAQGCPVPCIVQPGIEEICFGLWEGLTWKQVAERYPEEYELWIKNRRTQKAPRGESYQDLVDRTLIALAAIAEAEGGPEAEGAVLVVTHSGLIMALLSYLHQTPFSEMVKRYRTENAGIYPVDAAELFRVKG